MNQIGIKNKKNKSFYTTPMKYNYTEYNKYSKENTQKITSGKTNVLKPWFSVKKGQKFHAKIDSSLSY